MKNIHEVLKIKEQQLQQIQREIEALRVAARLLVEESDMAGSAVRPVTSTNVPMPQMIMRPAPAAAGAQPVAAPKEPASYVAPSAWDIPKPQFP